MSSVFRGPNLIRRHMSVTNEDEAKVIDNNDALKEKVREKMRRMQQADPDGFIPGLGAEEIDTSLYDEDGNYIGPEEGYEGEDGEYVPPVPEMDMSAYKEMADGIINEATEEADAIRAQAEAEAIQIKNAAKDQGFAEGMAQATAKATEEAAKRKQEFELERARLLAEHKEKLNEMEPQVVSVVADIFEKVFRIQFEGKKDIILNLVRGAVDGIENSKEFLIKVPKENLQFIMEHKEELQDKVGQYVSIEIISDGELTDNQCIIETDSGVFDCSLDIQLDNLVRDLKSLSVVINSERE
ncbi:MAG: hypothetical protein IK054_05995 [Lachnospiraceae bacterium]|nr:hypothetical protein [Lachnospiraceae bacterium]